MWDDWDTRIIWYHIKPIPSWLMQSSCKCANQSVKLINIYWKTPVFLLKLGVFSKWNFLFPTLYSFKFRMQKQPYCFFFFSWGHPNEWAWLRVTRWRTIGPFHTQNMWKASFVAIIAVAFGDCYYLWPRLFPSGARGHLFGQWRTDLKTLFLSNLPLPLYPFSQVFIYISFSTIILKLLFFNLVIA